MNSEGDVFYCLVHLKHRLVIVVEVFRWVKSISSSLTDSMINLMLLLSLS